MAERLGTPPRTQNLEIPANNHWFDAVGNRLKIYSGINDPTVAEVPKDQWIVYRNKTLGEVRMWTNIGGVLKKSAAFT